MIAKKLFLPLIICCSGIVYNYFRIINNKISNYIESIEPNLSLFKK